MAQRRMTSLEVIDTDAFLDMPMSSQLLYFHLNARADDDGFVANPKKVLRTLGGSSDDYRVLVAKKFLIEFEDGVCVIKHWRINNFVRKDLYKETKYLDLKGALLIRPNGAYTLSDDGEAVPVPRGHFTLEDVNESLTKRQLRIGKGRVGKLGVASAPQVKVVEESEKEERTKTKPTYPNARTAFSWFPSPEANWGINTTELKHGELLYSRGEDAVRGIIKFCLKHEDMEFFSKWRKPSALERNWNDIIDFAKRNGL